jgi:hypothetical protein
VPLSRFVEPQRVSQLLHALIERRRLHEAPRYERTIAGRRRLEDALGDRAVGARPTQFLTPSPWVGNKAMTTANTPAAVNAMFSDALKPL